MWAWNLWLIQMGTEKLGFEKISNFSMPVFCVEVRRERGLKWTFWIEYIFYGPERHFFWDCVSGCKMLVIEKHFPLYPPPFFFPYKLSMMKLAWRIVPQFDIEAHLNCLKSHNDNFVDLWLFQVGIQRWVLRKFQISPCPFFLCRSGAGVAGLLLKWTFGVGYLFYGPERHFFWDCVGV